MPDANERIARLEADMDHFRRDMDRIADSVESLSKSAAELSRAIERLTVGGRAVWWFLGVMATVVIGAISIADSLKGWFR